MRLPGFEPGSRNWQSRILTKLYYNRLTDLEFFSLLKGTVWKYNFLTSTYYVIIMNPQLEEKVNQKIKEVTEKSDEIFKIINSLDDLRTHSNSFAYGIAVGRLYNSFYYQCRRILKRNPTNEEFSEFVAMLDGKQKEILDALRLD